MQSKLSVEHSFDGEIALFLASCKRALDYIISRVSHEKKAKIKIIKSLLKNEHPCEYAVFLTGFLEDS
jgi:hypothetical protein